jgi:hypothetical protein
MTNNLYTLSKMKVLIVFQFKSQVARTRLGPGGSFNIESERIGQSRVPCL